MSPTPTPTPAFPGAPDWLTPSLAGPLIGASVAVLALFFTIGSFWWLNARRGKVVGFPPSAFAAGFTSRSLILVVPLVLLNSGAVPIVLTDLRLRLGPSRWQRRYLLRKPPQLILRLRGTHEKLPSALTPPRLPTVVAVAGRKTEPLVVEFGLKEPAFVPAGAVFRARVEGRMPHRSLLPRRSWQSIVVFDLQLSRISGDGGFAAMSNDPGWKP